MASLPKPHSKRVPTREGLAKMRRSELLDEFNRGAVHLFLFDDVLVDIHAGDLKAAAQRVERLRAEFVRMRECGYEMNMRLPHFGSGPRR